MDRRESPAQLVARIRAGDPRAESELVERFHRGTRLMLRRLVNDPAAADDLLQETLTLVLHKARQGEIRDPDRLAGFIRSTARNLLIADRRKEVRYAAFDNAEVLETLARRNAAGRDSSVDEVPQLERVLRNEEARLVRELLGELRYDRDRELLVRFYLSDDDKDRLCADLGIDTTHFRRVLFRARQRLRELWDQRQKRGWVELRRTG